MTLTPPQPGLNDDLPSLSTIGRPRGAAARIRTWFRTHAGEELTIDEAAALFDVGEASARTVIYRMFDAGELRRRRTTLEGRRRDYAYFRLP